MRQDQTVLVTGITGNVGNAVAAHAGALGFTVRGLVRRPESVRRGAGEGDSIDTRVVEPEVELQPFEFTDVAPDPAIFRGITQLFLMRPPSIADVETRMFPFLRAAREEGVEHIVFLSLLGAEKMGFVPHRKLEREIVRLGFRYSFLRAGFFMQNLTTVFRDFIVEDSELPVPAGRGKTSFVDSRDLGEAAARLFLEPTGATAGGSDIAAPSRALELTGSQALDYYEVARELSNVLGRTITYPRPSLAVFKRRVLADGWDPKYATIVGRLYYTVRFGIAKKVTGSLADILGRSPRTFAQFAADYAAELQG